MQWQVHTNQVIHHPLLTMPVSMTTAETVAATTITPSNPMAANIIFLYAHSILMMTIAKDKCRISLSMLQKCQDLGQNQLKHNSYNNIMNKTLSFQSQLLSTRKVILSYLGETLEDHKSCDSKQCIPRIFWKNTCQVFCYSSFH